MNAPSDPRTSGPPSGFRLRQIFPPAVGLLGIGVMLATSYGLREGRIPTISFTGYGQLDLMLTMQCVVFPFSFLVLGAMYLYDARRFRRFFRAGEIDAEAQPLRWLGIREGTRWKRVGWIFAAILSVGTAIFMTIGVIQMDGVFNAEVWKLLPLALLFSTTNAWSEEVFTRFTVVAGLDGEVRPTTKYWISAAIFGIPHYLGTPGGPIGLLMAGFMGWLLAKSVHETRGLFWAWFLHFIQDVIIFTASLMILMGAQ